MVSRSGCKQSKVLAVAVALDEAGRGLRFAKQKSSSSDRPNSDSRIGRSSSGR